MDFLLCLCVERLDDGTTYNQYVSLSDIDIHYIEFDADGVIYLNLKALSMELFGSGYKICSARLC